MAPIQPITFNRSKKPFVVVCRIYKNPRLKLQRELVANFSSEMDDGEYEERQLMLVDSRRNFATLLPKQHLFVQAHSYSRVTLTTSCLYIINSSC